MSLYNFKKRFVSAIRSGKKKHTIRAIRKRPNKPGDTLHLYVGLRHPGARLIARVNCTKIEDIKIWRDRARNIQISIDDVILVADEKDMLALADGFESFEDMMQFWIEPKNRLPFRGHIIHWN